MKKTLRNAIAMLLALVIACGSLTAFAQTPGDIEWYFGGDEAWIYSYAGTLTVGEDTVLPPVSDVKSVYLTLEIEESGYYKITVDSDIWYGIPADYVDGAYEDAMDSMAYADSVSPRYYYLEEGETIIGFDLYEDKGVTARVDPVGNITAIEFDRSQLEDRLLGYNLYEGDEGAYLIDVDVAKVKFSNDEELELAWACIYVYSEIQLVKGENTVEIGLWGVPYREEATVSIIEITDIIESVEVSNLKDYAYVTEYYNGNIYAPQMYDETVTVTYTDGTTETLEGFSGYGYLEECGYPVDTVYEKTDGEWTVVVYVAGQNMLQEKCTVENATTSENLIEYKDNVFDGIQYIISWVSIYMNDVFLSASFGEAIASFANAARNTVSLVVNFFGDLFSQTKGLIGSVI